MHTQQGGQRVDIGFTAESLNLSSVESRGGIVANAATRIHRKCHRVAHYVSDLSDQGDEASRRYVLGDDDVVLIESRIYGAPLIQDGGGDAANENLQRDIGEVIDFLRVSEIVIGRIGADSRAPQNQSRPRSGRVGGDDQLSCEICRYTETVAGGVVAIEANGAGHNLQGEGGAGLAIVSHGECPSAHWRCGGQNRGDYCRGGVK